MSAGLSLSTTTCQRNQRGSGWPEESRGTSADRRGGDESVVEAVTSATSQWRRRVHSDGVSTGSEMTLRRCIVAERQRRGWCSPGCQFGNDRVSATFSASPENSWKIRWLTVLALCDVYAVRRILNRSAFDRKLQLWRRQFSQTSCSRVGRSTHDR